MTASEKRCKEGCLMVEDRDSTRVMICFLSWNQHCGKAREKKMDKRMLLAS